MDIHIIVSLITLVVILGFIVFACVVFTNAIEHLGERLHLSQGAVGSVLAAVGTALPETLVPIVAIVGSLFISGNVEVGNEIGIGAILGAPFLLGTLAFCVTGLAVYYYAAKGKRTRDMPVNTSVMKRDMHYFLLVYVLAVGASFLPNHFLKVIVAVALIGIYALYVYLTLKDNSHCETTDEELPKLYLARYMNDSLFLTIFQVVLSIGLIIILAHFFVENLKEISIYFNISPLILSLIIAPIATELPEKFNSIIWIRGKKDTLALGNITGAMVFQSCIPPAVGILLTPWILDEKAIMSVILVYISLILVYINLSINKNVLKPWILVIGGLFYVIYLIYLILPLYYG